MYSEKIRTYLKHNLHLAVNNGCRHCSGYVVQDGDSNLIRLKEGTCVGYYAQHASSCLNVLKQVDKTLLKAYCVEQSSELPSKRKLGNDKITELLNFIGEDTSFLVTSISSAKNHVSYNMYAEDYLLSSVIVFSPSDFPNKQGIYLIRFLNNDKWNVLYIGKSIDLKNRWKEHHRMPEIEILNKLGIQLEYRYLAETSLMKFDRPLGEIERILIDSLKPKLNNTSVINFSKFSIS